jgi:hypothetical protein
MYRFVTPEQERENREFISGLSMVAISDMLLNRSALFGALIFGYERSPETQLKSFYDSVDEKTQSKFKLAVVHALVRWTLSLHETSTLEMLALTAAYIRAEDAITPLARIIEQKQPFSADAEQDKSTRASLIAVIQGFSPSEKVMKLFEQWYSDLYYAEHAAQLLIGLSKCTPRKYPEYLTQFFAVETEHPRLFQFASCITLFG